VSWLLRFLIWATVLAAPCWLIGDAYHRALAAATLGVLGLPAPAAAIPPPDIPPSHVLGVFAAMCLASTETPRARRFRATLIGLGALVAIEWLTGVLAVAWAMREGGHELPFVVRLHENLTTLPAWIGAPALWLALLGDAELPPRGHGGGEGRGSSRRRGKGRPVAGAPSQRERRETNLRP
jgi:hypothetical protein